MHDTLNFRRLGMLIRRHWAENVKFFLLGTLALFGLMAIVFSIWIIGSGTRYQEEDTWVIFLTGLFITGCIFASISFNALSDKAKGTYWMSLPASHLEKLIVTILFTTVFFFAVYSLCFFPLRQMAFAYLESAAKENPLKYKLTYIRWKENDEIRLVARSFFLAFIAVQSLFLLGSVYFKKFAYVKTVIFGAVFVFLFVWMMTGIDEKMFTEFGRVNWNVFEARKLDIHGGGTPTQVYKVSELSKDFSLFMLQYMWAPVFWVVAWFRLKETEI
ncbi:MAG: hypothetical protein ACO1NW_00855 [Chitinophagaceae bacterium]